MTKVDGGFYPQLGAYCRQTAQQFGLIPESRKEILQQAADFITQGLATGEEHNLTFICIQNSRRSHFGQVWATVAAWFYNIEGIVSFSGGTAVSAIHPNTLAALQNAGIIVEQQTEGENPRYTAWAGSRLQMPVLYSKVYNDVANPQQNYTAIMVCGEGDEACPIVAGADKRFLISYADPKKFDGTPQQTAMYDWTCQQIAREVFYMFHLIKKQ